MKRLEMSRRWGRAKSDMKTLSRSKTDRKVGQRVIWQFICVMYLYIDGITNLNFYFISVSGKEPKTHFCFNNALQICSPTVCYTALPLASVMHLGSIPLKENSVKPCENWSCKEIEINLCKPRWVGSRSSIRWPPPNEGEIGERVSAQSLFCSW